MILFSSLTTHQTSPAVCKHSSNLFFPLRQPRSFKKFAYLWFADVHTSSRYHFALSPLSFLLPCLFPAALPSSLSFHLSLKYLLMEITLAAWESPGVYRVPVSASRNLQHHFSPSFLQQGFCTLVKCCYFPLFPGIIFPRPCFSSLHPCPCSQSTILYCCNPDWDSGEMNWKSPSCIQLFATPWTYTVHGILQARNTGVGSLSLFQGIFPTQGLNPGLPHCRQSLFQLSQLRHQGSPGKVTGIQAQLKWHLESWKGSPHSSFHLSIQQAFTKHLLCINYWASSWGYSWKHWPWLQVYSLSL